MAEGHIIFKICPICGGDGKMLGTSFDEQGNPSGTEYDCVVCGGYGNLLWGYMTKDDETIPDNLPIP